VSEPSFQVLNTPLLTASTELDPGEHLLDLELQGCLVESAVGAHLLNTSAGTGIEVFYWREGDREVDFVLRKGRSVALIEVKSGRLRGGLPGMDAFEKVHGRARRRLLVGEGGIPLEEFLRLPAGEWV